MQTTTATVPAPIASRSKAFTIAAHIARVVLGIIFLVFGLNGFLHFIPMPPPAGQSGEFMFGLSRAPYMFPVVFFFQVVSGVLLLAGRFVPLALLLLFPIALNILLFHATLAPEGMGMAILVMAAIITLTVYNWAAFKRVFQSGNAWIGRAKNQALV